MEKKITLVARKATTSRGQVFYKTSANVNGTWYKVSFNKSAGARPEQSGIYEVIVDPQDVSIAEGKPYTDKNGVERLGNDTLWIARYVALNKVSNEELRRREQAKVDAIFGIGEEI